jgi:CRISPR-associated endonuclease Cas2
MSAVKSIANAVGIAGALGLVLVAPNALQAFSLLAKQQGKKPSRSYADYLQRTGYFEAQQQNDRFVIRLTEKGQRAAVENAFENYSLTTKTTWDGNWHLIMFDIPETHRAARQNISRRLQNLGLKPVQNSVYAHPYDLAHLAQTIRQTYPDIASLILSATVSRLDGEPQLRKAFELS